MTNCSPGFVVILSLLRIANLRIGHGIVGRAQEMAQRGIRDRGGVPKRHGELREP